MKTICRKEIVPLTANSAKSAVRDATHRQFMNENTVRNENSKIVADEEMHGRIALGGRQKEIVKDTGYDSYHGATPLSDITNEKRCVHHIATFHTVNLPIIITRVNEVT